MKRLANFPSLVDRGEAWAAQAAALCFLHELSDRYWPAGPPPSHDWDSIGQRRDKGQALDQALTACERSYPAQLAGAFADIRFQSYPDAVISRAIQDTERFCGLANHPRNGLAREELLGTLHTEASATGRQSMTGEYHTPWGLAQTVAAMAAINPADWVLEPAAGSGVLVLAALANLRERYGLTVARSVTFVCVELMADAAQACRLNLVLAGAADSSVVFCGNALARPVLATRPDGEQARVNFHAALANPPFGGNTRLGDLDAILEREGPFVIPDRLLNRAVLVPRRSSAHPAADRDESQRPEQVIDHPARKPSSPTEPASSRDANDQLTLFSNAKPATTRTPPSTTRAVDPPAPR